MRKYALITYGCIRLLLHSFSFLIESVDTLVEISKDEDFILTKIVFGDRWQLVKQKL